MAKILSYTDIIISNKRHYYIESVWDQYIHAHEERPLVEVGQIIRDIHPDYERAFLNLKNRSWVHMFNMFIMRKVLFDLYCE